MPLVYNARAAAGTFYVDLNGICGGYLPCHLSIGEAVSAATPGDEIIVYPGTYMENVAVDKASLTIHSKDGKQSTVVQAANTNVHVFDILVEDVTIAGFTIQNASSVSAGINVSADHAQILSNTITGNDKGIQIWGGSHILIHANDISNNRAYPTSDGVYITWGNHFTLTNNIISNNNDEGVQREVGGSGEESLHIYNSEIISNGGEGVYFGSSEGLIISNTTIISNGLNGVYAPNSDNLFFGDCTIAGNQGYGVHTAYGLDISVQNCEICGNQGSGLLFETGDSEIPEDPWDAGSFHHNYSLKNSAVTGNGEDGVNWGSIPVSGTIVGNLIGANAGHGLTFGGRLTQYFIYPGPVLVAELFSKDHLIAGNNILENGQNGIYLRHWAGDNDIFLNNFIDNSTNVEVVQPYKVTRWRSGVVMYTYNGRTFTGELGNHWSDYEGPDEDQNGVGDPPFFYPPTEPHLDFFPLISPFENYLSRNWQVFLPIIIR